MNNHKFGFFINSLRVIGPNKSEAFLEFNDGLNVISGASDTGKSFAMGCIDYAFGASKVGRSIQELNGYDRVILELTSRLSGNNYQIQRKISGGNVTCILKKSTGERISDNVIPAKHSPTDSNTLSGILLELSGLWGQQVRKNAKGGMRTLSFRDVAYLCSVDEERIITERPPQLSGNHIEKTVESEAFRLLITGNESGTDIFYPQIEKNESYDAKIELIQSMIEKANYEFKKIGLNEKELIEELSVLDETRKETLHAYEQSRIKVTKLEETRNAHLRNLQEVKDRISIVCDLIKRFHLLEKHYDSDIIRLVAIEESGTRLQTLPSIPCPVCGTAPEFQSHKFIGEEYQVSNIHIAALAELEKINILKTDLRRVLEDLDVEYKNLDISAKQEADWIDSFQSQLEAELLPRIKETLITMKSQDDRREFIQHAKEMLDQIHHLSQIASELAEKRNAKRKQSIKIPTNSTSGEMAVFAETVENILKMWNYPNIGRVIFSEKDQDIVIGNNPRNSHGKGVRALTCAAYILGIMQHCQKMELPHPNVVILDSPLVAYREPDGDHDESKMIQQAGVKEAFYGSLASGGVGGQIIIFENEDPSLELQGAITTHHFTKTSTGRYGFFPH